MKCIRRPLRPTDKMFQGPPIPYTPGSLAKKPEPPAPPGSTPGKAELPQTKKPRRDDA